jgi:catechol 2,3-dioxygenase-like lactoylglutathione lyase family enzyme
MPIRRCEHRGDARIDHLCLPVHDPQHSQAFYARYFGFRLDDVAPPEDGSVPLRDSHGFQLTLHIGRDGDPPGGLHFGFRASDAAAIREQLARLEADGVAIAARYDVAAKVAFQCVDPDGYHVEVYWEA